MSIFDVFTIKKESKNFFTKENFEIVLKTARHEIIEQIKSNIPGVEKKAIVDATVIKKIEALALGCSNKILLWIIERIISCIPAITQLIYDFLKEKIENL
jgi:hypothetical protein